nr:alpha/beta hydrolase [Actinokineospora enzanensis]
MAEVVARVPVGVQAAVVRAVVGMPAGVRRMLVGAPVRVDGQELALEAQLVLWFNRLVRHSFLAEQPEVARGRMDRSRGLIGGPAIPGVATREVPVGRVYVPTGVGERAPLLVFYHGGGWVVGSVDSHDDVCRFLAWHAGVKVLSVEYRLAPEEPFPAAVDDAMAGFRYAVENAAELGIDPELIAVGGDSAGGNLAAVTAYQAKRNDSPQPVFQMLLYPAVDATTRRASRDLFTDGYFLTDADIDWFCDHYCPDVEQRGDVRISVLGAEDLSGLPAAYIATAGFDPLRDEGAAYAERLREAGVPVVYSCQRDLIHGYASFFAVGTRFREALLEAATALRLGLALNGR